jgi:hypothetical protein
LAPAGTRRGRFSVAEAFPVRGHDLFNMTAEQPHSLSALEARVAQVQRGNQNYLPKVSVVSAEHRLIVNRLTGLEEFYDRRVDPAETTDLGADRLPEHRRLKAELQAWADARAEDIYCRVVKRTK